MLALMATRCCCWLLLLLHNDGFHTNNVGVLKVWSNCQLALHLTGDVQVVPLECIVLTTPLRLKHGAR